MRSFVFVLCIFMSNVGFADQDVSGVIVSVYRPLEMQSRRVTVARKVFIQSNRESAFPERLVGQVLTVYRRHEVPAQVSIASRAEQESHTSEPESKISKDELSATQTVTLKPLSSGRPTGFAKPRHVSSVKGPIYLGEGGGGTERVSEIVPTPVNGAPIREFVGKIRVLSVDGEVAIAEVIEDGLRGKETPTPTVRSVERQTVSAGDEVEGVIKKIKKPKKAVPLSKAEKRALTKERERIRRSHKRKKRRGKFQRKVMSYPL
ncbi:MAG: hypothetical protein ACPGQS_13065 [Bradymonadia bacterium]